MDNIYRTYNCCLLVEKFIRSYDDSIWFLTGLFIDECMEGFMSPEQAGICAAASSVNTYPGSSTKQGCTGSYQSFHPRNSQGFGHDPYVVINIDCPAWVHEYYGPQPDFHGSRQYVVMPNPIKYSVAIPKDSPPITCSVGNPVDISTGSKIQKELILVLLALAKLVLIVPTAIPINL